jgi:hypothetical protein
MTDGLVQSVVAPLRFPNHPRRGRCPPHHRQAWALQLQRQAQSLTPLWQARPLLLPRRHRRDRAGSGLQQGREAKQRDPRPHPHQQRRTELRQSRAATGRTACASGARQRPQAQEQELRPRRRWRRGPRRCLRPQRLRAVGGWRERLWALQQQRQQMKEQKKKTRRAWLDCPRRGRHLKKQPQLQPAGERAMRPRRTVQKPQETPPQIPQGKNRARGTTEQQRRAQRKQQQEPRRAGSQTGRHPPRTAAHQAQARRTCARAPLRAGAR